MLKRRNRIGKEKEVIEEEGNNVEGEEVEKKDRIEEGDSKEGDSSQAEEEVENQDSKSVDKQANKQVDKQADKQAGTSHAQPGHSAVSDGSDLPIPTDSGFLTFEQESQAFRPLALLQEIIEQTPPPKRTIHPEFVRHIQSDRTAKHGFRYTDAQIAKVIVESDGMLARASNRLGCGIDTLSRRIQKSGKLTALLKQITESTLDLCESKLRELVRMRDRTSIMFYLKCKGKQRGWIDTVEVVGSAEKPVVFKYVIATPNNPVGQTNTRVRIGMDIEQSTSSSNPDPIDITPDSSINDGLE